MDTTPTRCTEHPAFEADYCPSCGTAQQIGQAAPAPAEMARRMELARSAIASDPTLGGLLDAPIEIDSEITSGELVEAIADRFPQQPISVEMTGGGCATIYAGRPNRAGRYAVAIGPGTYRGPADSLFSFEELYVGPDDDGEGRAYACRSVADVLRAVSVVIR